MDTYSGRQIEAANLLKGESPELIDEVLQMVEEAEEKSAEPVVTREDTEVAIKWAILNETDWRKKAALSAMLISKSLDY